MNQPLVNDKDLALQLNGDRKALTLPIVFFGRLEERKGLCTFVEAIKSLDVSIKSRIKIYFIGKVVQLYSAPLKHLNSQQYVERELAGEIPYEIASNFFSKEAIAFIRNLGSPIVCLASPQENFPNAALEMGQLPVSLVVSDTGGFRETLGLLKRDSSVYWFTPKDSRSLYHQLSKAIAAYPAVPQIPDRSSIEAVNRDLLVQKLEHIERAFSQASAPEPKQHRVTVGVVHQGNDAHLSECLSSLETQTHEAVDVIVLNATVDDPRNQEQFHHIQSLFPTYKYVQLDEGSDLSLGAAFNKLVSLSNGDYFLPLISEYVLLPFAIENFVKAANQSQAAIVTCPRKYFGSKDGMLNFTGGSLPTLLAMNVCGDVCSLFSTSLLQKFKFIEERDVNTNGWEIMGAAVATGEKLTYYPYPLYERRSSSDPLLASSTPKDQYYLRQYLAQIPACDWSPRQIYMLLTAVQQLQTQSLAVIPSEDATSSSELKEVREKLKQARTRLKKMKQELERTKNRVESMETSKFWKFRRGWIKVKKTFGLAKDE
jgi:O-antigen biosynthesis protein